MSPEEAKRLPPVRVCCGERHFGALCNDGSVMCCLCFNRYPLSAMSETAEGDKTDVCPNCALIDHLQLRCRESAAEVVRLGAENAEQRVTIELLQEALDSLQLAYIEATNPGIDMDDVRCIRAGRAALSDEETPG